MTTDRLEGMTFRLTGKPTPYVRMTQRGKWVKPEAQRYLSSKAVLRAQLVEQMRGGEQFGKEPLGVALTFQYERGADHRRDLDNEIKAILDSANGVVWADDRWVDSISAVRRGGEGGDVVLMTVWTLGDALCAGIQFAGQSASGAQRGARGGFVGLARKP